MITVLYARRDSIYKTLPGFDVYDADRDALTWRGGTPVIAHPPCRMWGRLRNFSKPVPGEKSLALHAVHMVQTYGGVLEHPANSMLWKTCELPQPGEHDRFGGWTFPIHQYWWGHRACKSTWLYIVGVRPAQVPDMPMLLGHAPCVVENSSQSLNKKPVISKKEREATPPDLAVWLGDLASRVLLPA